MAELQYVGKPARRVDALEKVMGTAKYVADRTLPGMLHARCLRSDMPHARIVRLDVTPALAVPGVRAVITSDDFFEHGHYGFPVKDKYMLAYQKVRYVGEAIATVAADTPEAALAGVEAIICELEALPGVFDMRHSLDPDAPQVGPTRPDGTHPNFLDHLIVRKRNPEPDGDDALAVIGECAVQLDRSYSTCPQEHAYIEPEGVLAVPTRAGGVIVYAPNQSPFVNHGNLALVLDLPHNLVRVIQPPVGGSFGGKDDIIYESSAQAARLAMMTGRPVRMVFSREESLIASYKRDSMRMQVRLGADADGVLRACRFDGILDSGAYASESSFTGWRASIHAMGAYRYDACDVDVTCVYTNNGYYGAFRGFGNTEASVAIEQAIDEVASALDIDPMDFRLKNCLRVGDETPHGQILTESVGLPECLETVRRLSEWDRKRAEYSEMPAPAARPHIRRGIGVAAIFHGTSLGAEGSDYASSTLAVEQDNSIDMTSGLTDYGTGSRTVYTLIAAEELGVRPERIHMQRPDTDTAVESGPTVASRSTMLGGNATRIAAEQPAPDAGLRRRRSARLRVAPAGARWRGVCRPERGTGKLGASGRPRPRDGPRALRAGQVDRAPHHLEPRRRPGHTLHGLSLCGAGGRSRGGYAHRQRPGGRPVGRARPRHGDLPRRRVRPTLWRHRAGAGLRPDGADHFCGRLSAGDELRILSDPDLGGRAGDRRAVRRSAVLAWAIRGQEHRRAGDGADRARDPERHRARHGPPGV